MARTSMVNGHKKVTLLDTEDNSFNLFSEQKRLAILVVAAETGAPVNRVPIYAEITADVIDATQRSLPSLDDGLAALDIADKKKEALVTALGKEIDWPQALRVAGDDEDKAKSRLDLMLHAVTFIAQRAVDPNFHPTIEEWVKDVVSKAKSLPEFEKLEGADDSTAATRLSIPLGVLATDHTGFVSFDIAKYRDILGEVDLEESRGGIKFSLQVYPGLLEKTKFNALDQGRVTQDAVLAKYEMAQADLSAIPIISLGLPSIQNPSLTEWRLSPGSFATVPQSLIGADGCESLTPANFAVAQFNLRQVIRLAPDSGETTSNPNYPNGLIHEYTLSLIPIGHSLGSILYSLPLAPGESVRLAVIDWRRTDDGQRDEKTVITESLLHEQTRDRAISETVSAALDEWQRGGSVMGGFAAGGGGSGTSGPFGVAGGGMASIGGAYTTSSGTRNLTADSLQKVADAVHQASSDTREMQNSVIVQIDSTESESVQTRTFFNNNRGHTMTVLYYEMLRHFRMVVHFKRQYKAILVPRTPWVFDVDDQLILNKEYVLSPALLDDSLRPAFDAVRRADMARQDLIRNPPPKPSTDNPGDFLIVCFRMFFKVGGIQTSNALQMEITTKLNPTPTELLLHGQGNINADPTPFNRDSSASGFVIATDPMTPLKWSDLTQFFFRKASGSDDVAVFELSIDAVGANGDIKNVHQQIAGDYFYLKDAGTQYPLTIVLPPAAPPAQPEVTWQRVVSLEDYSAVMRLRAHIKANLEYYTRILDLSVYPNEYATRFETTSYDTRMLIDVVSPCPAEILGTKIAFPLLNQGDDDGPKDIPDEERLISLPTRGVFAEAKLGHCNVAEEIDDTRFWKWDEHPNPMVATEIQPVKVAEPTPASNLPLTPTAMPQSVVNIQQPLAAPDPTGLAAALKAITTPNVFRDMSGSSEVQQLLHDLIQGSISMAQAASAAKGIQDKQSTGGGGSVSAGRGGQAASDPVVSQAQAEDNRTLDQQVSPADAQHAIQLANNQAQKGTITKAQAADIAANQLSNMKGSQQPKPLPKAPKKWYFEVTLRGYGNMVLDGMWSWELSQGGTSLGFELMDKRPNGVIKIPFVLEGNDRRFKLSVSGQILSGYGVDANFSGKEILLEIPVDTFNNSNYAYITLDAVVATFKYTTTSSDALKKAWTNNANLSVSPPDVVKQIVSITGQGGETWGRDETHTTQTAEEWTITYYPGGFTVREVK